MGNDTPGLTVDSGETNTCLKVRDRSQPLPSPGLLLRKASGSPAWPPAPRREARHPGAHVTRMGRTVSSHNRRAQQATELVSSTPRSPAPGHSAAPQCPAEGLPGTELPELERGCPSPAGRSQEWSVSGLGVGEGQGRPAFGALDSTTGAHPRDPRGEAASSLLMLPPSGMP